MKLDCMIEALKQIAGGEPIDMTFGYADVAEVLSAQRDVIDAQAAEIARLKDEVLELNLIRQLMIDRIATLKAVMVGVAGNIERQVSGPNYATVEFAMIQICKLREAANV